MRDKILRYLELSGTSVDKMIEFVAQTQRDAFSVGAAEAGVSGPLPEAPARTLALIETTLRSEIGRNSLIDRVTAIYTEHFTEPEIDTLIEFFSSSAGRKISEISDELNPTDITTAWTIDMMKSISVDLTKIWG